MIDPLVLYTPAEVEALTGLAIAKQRAWRLRGFLKSTPGQHARFDLMDVADIYGMKGLADLGIGPQRSSKIMEPMGTRIWLHATGICLRGRLPPALLIWWPVGAPEFSDSYGLARAKLRPSDPRLHGPAIVFDLSAAGRAIAQRVAVLK